VLLDEEDEEDDEVVEDEAEVDDEDDAPPWPPTPLVDDEDDAPPWPPTPLDEEDDDGAPPEPAVEVDVPPPAPWLPVKPGIVFECAHAAKPAIASTHPVTGNDDILMAPRCSREVARADQESTRCVKKVWRAHEALP
jgi:hypothetical protein